jgi:hypothetical protein
MKRQVIMTRLGTDTFERASVAVRDSDIKLHHQPWDDNTLELVQTMRFDAIVIGFPGPSRELRRFTEVVRTPGSASQHSGIVLLAEPGYLAAAEPFVGIGAGINRAIGSDDIDELLEPAIIELTTIAPRIPVCAPTRVVLHLEQRPLRTFCQTDNLSETGMLLRGFGHYPPGTTIDFQINIPGQSEPIRGSATIARTTNVENERFEGVGARFDDFLGADRSRLTDYLSNHVH